MNNTIFLKASHISSEHKQLLESIEFKEQLRNKIDNLLKDLKQTYPDIESWYMNTVISDMKKYPGKRAIIVSISKNNISNLKYEISGIAILKKTKEEKKICTFRIDKKYQNNGIGKLLFEECFKFLETDKPLFTVPREKKEVFQKYIEKFNFEPSQSLSNYYAAGSAEYVYNGCLPKINKKYQNDYISKLLSEERFKSLEINKFLFTVPSEKKEDFQKYIEKINFELSQYLSNYYTKNSAEYGYNECLSKIDKKYHNSGISKLLFEEYIKFLETDKPSFTVPSEKKNFSESISNNLILDRLNI